MFGATRRKRKYIIRQKETHATKQNYNGGDDDNDRMLNVCARCVLLLTKELLMIKLTEMAIHIFFILYKEHSNWFGKRNFFFRCRIWKVFVSHVGFICFSQNWGIIWSNYRRRRKKYFLLAAFYIFDYVWHFIRSASVHIEILWLCWNGGKFPRFKFELFFSYTGK